MSTPEPEPDAVEPPLRRIKMRAGYDGDESVVSVSGRTAGAPVKGKALVMGVENYGGERRLKNTLNDANAVAQTFHDVGFDTHKYTDETAEGGKVSYGGMGEVIQAFVDEIDENTGAVFAFMGKPPSDPPCSLLNLLGQGTERSRRASTTSSRRSSRRRSSCRTSPSSSRPPSRRSRPSGRSSRSPSSTAAGRARRFARATAAAKA